MPSMRFFRSSRDRTRAGFDSEQLKDRTVIVQGLGNVGYHAAKFLSEDDGCKITAVIERDGVCRNPDCLNIDAVKTHLQNTGGLRGFAGGTFDPDGAKALEDRCDILIPAALEGAVHVGNAGQINCRLLVEAANGPVTFEADRTLRERRIEVIPDMLANAGGVVGSYFEWVKNLTHIPFGLMERRTSERDHMILARSLERMTGKPIAEDDRSAFLSERSEINLVRSGLEEMMHRSFSEVSELAGTSEGFSLRDAAYQIAIKRVAGAYQVTGI